MSASLKVCSKKWRELLEEERAVYEEAYKADLLIYKEKLKEWEVKMINKGNVHLVRVATFNESVNARRQTLMKSDKKPTRKKLPKNSPTEP